MPLGFQDFFHITFSDSQECLVVFHFIKSGKVSPSYSAKVLFDSALSYRVMIQMTRLSANMKEISIL
jgi:hypothetical protein